VAQVDFDVVVVGKDFPDGSQDSIQGSADNLRVEVFDQFGSDAEV
jgi:hypothetical protein